MDCRFEDVGLESRLTQGYFVSLQRSNRLWIAYSFICTVFPVKLFSDSWSVANHTAEEYKAWSFAFSNTFARVVQTSYFN